MRPHNPYLSGMDWVLVALDRMTKEENRAGMAMQLVLELDRAVPTEKLRRGLETLVEPFPEVWSVIRRAWHFAPYWSPRRPPAGALAPTIHRARNEHEVRELLERTVNEPFANDLQHLSCTVIETEEKTLLALLFDHRLFDARGAEAFAARLEAHCREPGSVPREIRNRPDHLRQWADKFRSGRVANAALARIFDDLEPRMLPHEPLGEKRRVGFREICFDADETEAVLDRAESQAGAFMAMPYSLAIAFRVMHALFSARGVTGRDYVVPVMADARDPRASQQEILFNHFSFLLFRASASTVESFPDLVDSLKDQMYEQVKVKLTQNLAAASLLGRIVPLAALTAMSRSVLDRGLASFCFSFLGETNQAPERFLGANVTRSYHLPTVPFPPGIGIFLRQARGRLSAQLSFVEGGLTEAEADRVLAGIEEGLRG